MLLVLSEAAHDQILTLSSGASNSDASTLPVGLIAQLLPDEDLIRLCVDDEPFFRGSGQSQNMIIGAKKAKEMKLDLVTLSGFSGENPLRKLGQVNLWVDSKAYNIVEMTHSVLLLSVVYIIENVADTQLYINQSQKIKVRKCT
mgnify:CR=1 FL=1